jgi:hypothetical protein
MVFGPAMDVVRARKEGVTPLQVLVRGNRLVSSQLTLRIKLAFWATNGPYWMLSMGLLATPPATPQGCGPSWAHACAVMVVAAASSVFHGSVLFSLALGARHSLDHITAVLLGFDMVAANCYGATLAWNFGLRRSLALFSFPLMLLMLSAYTKRTGRPVLYAFLHGTWHLLSAAAMWRVLYFDETGARRTVEAMG